MTICHLLVLCDPAFSYSQHTPIPAISGFATTVWLRSWQFAVDSAQSKTFHVMAMVVEGALGGAMGVDLVRRLKRLTVC
jgi:hypothetical protein